MKAYVCFTLVDTAEKLSKVFVTIYVPTSSVRVPVAPCPQLFILNRSLKMLMITLYAEQKKKKKDTDL